MTSGPRGITPRHRPTSRATPLAEELEAPAGVTEASVERTDPGRARAFQAIGRLTEPAQSGRPGEPLAIARYLDALLDEDFLRFFPPEAKRSVIDALRGALKGAWAKLRDLGRSFSAHGMLEAAIDRGQAALDPRHGAAQKIKPLTREEKRALRELFNGVVSEVLRATGESPSDVPALLRALDRSEVQERLVVARVAAGASDADAREDVAAATAVARAVLERIDQHLIVGVVDRSVLDGDRVIPERLALLSPALQIVLTDPVLSPAAIAALKRGEVLSAQVMKKTPPHLIEQLREVSRSVAGGSYLWVQEYLRAGLRPAISGGDLRRCKQALADAASGLERLVERARSKLEVDLSDAERRALGAALGSPAGGGARSAEERATDLEALAGQIADRAVGHDVRRLARALRTTESIREADPEGLARAVDAKLDAFESERGQAMRVRVHGGSAAARGLEARISRHAAIDGYRQRVVEHTVAADYANQSSDTAKSIALSVAALSLLGVPIQRYLGEGAMTAILASTDDLLGVVGEANVLHGMGVAWRDVLLGWQNAGLVPTMALGMWMAGQTEALVNAGHGAKAGAAIAVGSAALTLYSTLASVALFRELGRELVAEGKITHPDLVREARASLSAAARRATDVLSGTDAPIPPDLVRSLEGAFDALKARHQGVPDGHALAREVSRRDASLSTAALDAISRAHDDVLSLLQVEDPDRQLTALSRAIAESFVRAAADRALSLGKSDAADVESRVHAVLSRLGDLKAASPERVVEVTERVLSTLAEAAAGHPLDAAQAAALAQAGAEIRAEVPALQEQLDRELKPALKKLASAFAFEQVFANPVRLRVAEAVAVGFGVSVAVGAVAPALLHLPVTIAALSSVSSALTAVRLRFDERRHRRALDQIGVEVAHQAVERATIARAATAPI
ncbi:MAG: hypothetical protein IT384_17050 [Deltaproteobacteria bacterium]|nr:hypothetical protein [Deltaproteobacteria bacterium]